VVESNENSSERAIEPYVIVRRTWFSTPVTMSAIWNSVIVTMILFLGSMIYFEDILQARTWMPASYESVFVQHHLSGVWTTLFAHANVKHLLSNSFLFFILGVFLNHYFGLLLFPIMAFVFGGVVNLIVLSHMPPEAHLIGASGIVYWMGGAWLVLYTMIDVRRSLLQRLIRSVGVGLVLFMPAEAFDEAISYRAHFVGFILGVIFGFFYYFSHRKLFASAVVTETILEEE
jgi:rhomboid protease GluP